MKKPQWITLVAGICLVALIYRFEKTVPDKKPVIPTAVTGLTADTFLTIARKQLTPEQSVRLNKIEHSVSRGDVKDQQLGVYRQLAAFWHDSLNLFEPFAWYTAEAARLENSEKSLNFAARLFLDNLQSDDVDERRRWKALQAKDLFERSLKINPENDSSKVGLGACYLFGNISDNPMEGILKIREVAERDSTNLFAQTMLAKGAMLSGQYDKAIARLQTISRLDTGNVEIILMLADAYEHTGDKMNAVNCYRRSLQYIAREDVRTEIEQRITALTK